MCLRRILKLKANKISKLLVTIFFITFLLTINTAAATNNLVWNGNWGTVYSKHVKVLGSPTNYIQYKASIEIQQIFDESDPNMDYYGIAIDIWQLDNDNFVDAITTNIEITIHYTPYDTALYLDTAYSEAYDPSEGPYNSIDFSISVSITIDPITATISWSSSIAYGVCTTDMGTDHGNNYFNWKLSSTLVGQLTFTSLMPNGYTRLLIIAKYPDASHNVSGIAGTISFDFKIVSILHNIIFGFNTANTINYPWDTISLYEIS